MAADIHDATTQADAVAMNNALLAHGYKISDQPIYRTFQSDAGLTADGFPGRNTMSELQDVLFAMGVEIAPVPIYPWLASGGYDGVNAPTAAQWGVSAGTVVNSNSNNSNSSTTVSTASMLPAWGWWLVAGAAVVGVALVAESAMKHPLAQGPRHATKGMHHHARKLLKAHKRS
jgi:hypothetical protein